MRDVYGAECPGMEEEWLVGAVSLAPRRGEETPGSKSG